MKCGSDFGKDAPTARRNTPQFTVAQFKYRNTPHYPVLHRNHCTMPHYNASEFYTPMQEKGGPTIRSASAGNMDTVGSGVVGDTQALVNSASPSLSRKRQRSKLSIDEGLKAVQAAALSLEESFRLTDTQEAAIRKCFQLIKEDSSTTLSARAQREKSKRSFQVYYMLRNIREMLGLQGFLLCALALKPTQMQSMTKEDATNFPYRLKRWWEDFSPSSERLEAVASKVKAFDDQIPYLPLADEMSESLNLRRPPDTSLTKNHEIRIFLIICMTNTPQVLCTRHIHQ